MNTPKDIEAILKQSKCLYTLEEVDQAIDQLAQAITVQLAEDNPLLLCVMIGGMFITSALSLRLDFPLNIDFLHVSRYRGQMRPGDLHWHVEPHFSLKDRTILIVDDILEGGVTLASIIDYCHTHKARAVHTAVMLDKDHPRQSGGLEQADFTGLSAEDSFIFGYGLDYDEYLRNVPGIYAVSKKV